MSISTLKFPGFMRYMKACCGRPRGD